VIGVLLGTAVGVHITFKLDPAGSLIMFAGIYRRECLHREAIIGCRRDGHTSFSAGGIHRSMGRAASGKMASTPLPAKSRAVVSEAMSDRRYVALSIRT
jgi:hypothetical protein